MSKAEAQTQEEPSMEEILASIRRIISEDGEEDAQDDAAPVAEAANDAPVADQSAGEPEEVEAAMEESPAQQAPEETPQETTDTAQAADAMEEEEDILDLTEVVEDEEPVAQIAADAETETQEEPMPEPESEQEPEEELAMEDVSPEEGLVEEEIADASVAAFARLGEVEGKEEAASLDVALGNLNQTLEDMVREMLRPQIKSWLDANLPEIVEDIVRTEVERLGKRARK